MTGSGWGQDRSLGWDGGSGIAERKGYPGLARLGGRVEQVKAAGPGGWASQELPDPSSGSSNLLWTVSGVRRRRSLRPNLIRSEEAFSRLPLTQSVFPDGLWRGICWARRTRGLEEGQ